MAPGLKAVSYLATFCAQIGLNLLDHWSNFVRHDSRNKRGFSAKLVQFRVTSYTHLTSQDQKNKTVQTLAAFEVLFHDSTPIC